MKDKVEFKCPNCGRMFATDYNRMRHIRQKHRVEVGT